MARITIAQGLRQMPRLRAFDAGRLTAVRVYRSFLTHPDQYVADTPTPWRDRLRTAITARFAGTFTPDTPEYLVYSDNIPVALLTVTAQVVLPDYSLTANQVKHQKAAVAVLRELHRDTLRDLAARRVAWERGDTDTDADEQAQPGGALQVAPATDPTNACWVRIGADLAAARRAVVRACHAEPHQALIITAVGYGGYGHHRHRLDLPMLCAMHQIADTHGVSLTAVGNWLHTEGATTGEVSPATVTIQFAAAYLGAFPDRRSYTRFRMAELGWTQALAAAGIPDTYLNLDAMTRDWFGTEVRDVDAPGHIEVLRRHLAVDEPAPPPAG